ncbi:MAG TPA: hypothetical protein VFJ72_04915 [Rubrobacteraceae bacterium]|nr:hypothetical protein [Rubrobacteraceae bacterium]
MQRDLTRSYRGSFLGLVWLVLGPLLMVILYTLVFSKVLGLRFHQTDSVTNYGLYVYCGLLPFQAFSDALNKSVTSIRTNSTLVKRVVFPLEILPMTTAATAFVGQFFGFGALMVLQIVLEHHLQWTLLLIPIIAVPQLLFMLGLSYLISVAGAYMPDLKDSLRAFLRGFMFATPIIWPASRVPEDSPMRPFIDFNPLAFISSAYRDLVLSGDLPSLGGLLLFTLFAATVCLVGVTLFARIKRQFADLI